MEREKDSRVIKDAAAARARVNAGPRWLRQSSERYLLVSHKERSFGHTTSEGLPNGEASGR